MYILNDKMKNARKNRKFKCPYCNNRYTIPELIIHIDEEHIDLVPKKQTCAQVVYNLVNKREYGTCLICKGETDWDEDKWRYNSLCNKKSCHDKYIERFKSNMKKAGKENQMNDPEHQKKMLDGRKISGIYKFSDGVEKTYCASYEKQLLEFMDLVCRIKSEDVETPGPVIEYVFEGKKKFWITDVYFKPFNLVFDVKPGGNNKNTHPGMEINRRKQKAKQVQIRKDGIYNYIELTDNNFGELFTILKELKMNMINGNNNKIIKIYEDYQFKDIKYLVPYSESGYIIDGYCMSNSILLEDLFFIENSSLIKRNKSFLNNKYFSIYKGNKFNNNADNILSYFNISLPKEINYLDKLFDGFNGYDISNILLSIPKGIDKTNDIELFIEQSLSNIIKDNNTLFSFEKINEEISLLRNI